MTRLRFPGRTLAMLLVACVAAGCLPSAQSQLDEEKEPHYLAGKARITGMDYQGAIECFDKALEVNPQSAAAHFELGWLYDQKESNPAAAIYHYERFLRLRQNAENAQIVRTRIDSCKHEIARTVSLGPVTQALTEENRVLREERDNYRALYIALTNQSATASPAPMADRSAVPSGRVAEPVVGTASGGTTRSGVSVAVMTRAERPVPQASGVALRPSTSTPMASSRTHKVQAGETPFVIAHKYGVKLDKLLAANPGLEPKRMRVGQVVTIPAS